MPYYGVMLVLQGGSSTHKHTHTHKILKLLEGFIHQTGRKPESNESKIDAIFFYRFNEKWP